MLAWQEKRPNSDASNDGGGTGRNYGHVRFTVKAGNQIMRLRTTLLDSDRIGRRLRCCVARLVLRAQGVAATTVDPPPA